MDTTAAAELGMGGTGGGVDGVGFWDSGAADPDQWGEEDDELDDDLSWDRGGYGGAVLEPQVSGKGRGRPPPSGPEPPQKRMRSMPDGTQNSGMSSGSMRANNQSFSANQGLGPGFGRGGGGGGGGTPGRSNSSTGGFGAGGASPGGPGAGAVGRGRGMGSIFYKTKLCSRFRSGNCPYNTNCNFAHGMEELRKPPPGWEEFVASQELPPPPPKSPSQGGSGAAAGSTDSQVRFHKTRPCKKYFGEGNCPYGEKCNFLHDEQSAPRAVREAREAAAATAAAAAAPAAVVVSPKVETVSAGTNGNVKDSGGLTPGVAGNSNVRPPNWKTRLCNKWETTGHCPFGEKCHFAHGSDELQRYGGGPVDPNAPTPALSDSKSGGTPSKDTGVVSSLYNHIVRPSSAGHNARGGTKGASNWRGPSEISTIYGDWLEEEEYESGEAASHDVPTGDQEASETEGDAWRHVKRRDLPQPSSTPQHVPFFRGTSSRDLSRQNSSQSNGFSTTPRKEGGSNSKAVQGKGGYGVGMMEGFYGSTLYQEQGWGGEV